MHRAARSSSRGTCPCSQSGAYRAPSRPARVHGQEQRLFIVRRTLTACPRVAACSGLRERVGSATQRSGERSWLPVEDDLRAERHHEAHPEARGARIVRARDDFLQPVEGEVMLHRPLPYHVHEHVAAFVERRWRRLRAGIDPRQLGRRIARTVDVQKQQPGRSNVPCLLQMDLLALPEPGPLRGRGGLLGDHKRAEENGDREGLHARESSC